MSRITRRFRIVGKVQGVYFRHSTRNEAVRRGIAGYAENLPDASVEVLAHGSVEAVAELMRWLHRGPPSARVDQVIELTVEAEPDLGADPAFEVR
jgi:acylphosphatase